MLTEMDLLKLEVYRLGLAWFALCISKSPRPFSRRR